MHYSFDDLVRDGKTSWTGVKNPLAQKHLRSIQKGDRIFFYHTGDENAVAETEGAMGIIAGMSGQGEAMAANRVRGVRAAVYYGGPADIVKLSRRHNDANVLSLGARFVSFEDAAQAVDLWLSTRFEHDERHQRRILKMDYGG